MSNPDNTQALASALLRAAELYNEAIGKRPPPGGLAPVYEAVSELHRAAREYAAARKAGAPMKSPIELQLHAALLDCAERFGVCLNNGGSAQRFAVATTTDAVTLRAKAGDVVNLDDRAVAFEDIDWEAMEDNTHGDPNGPWWGLHADARIARYRLDFLMLADGQAFAIECDGFEYHERTAQQASRDRCRDRELALMGITTLRFTGSEIFHDADACAEHVLLLAVRLSEIYKKAQDNDSRLFHLGVSSAMAGAEQP